MENDYKHIETLVARGEIEQAISALNQLSVKHSDYKNLVIILGARYSQMVKAEIMGVITPEDKTVAINKISASILTLLKVVQNFENTGAFSPSDFLSDFEQIKLPDLQLGNVDARNLHFTGREQELKLLNETLNSGKTGILTAVHGIGGMGKTSLAIEYAYAYSHEYGGGCWVVRCEGKEDLKTSIAELVSPMGIELNAEEKKDTKLQFERVLAELRKLADAHNPKRCLLILDNVDKPKLLEPAQTKFISSKSWLNIVATTRLGESDLYGRQKDRAFVAVDELPEGKALSLIESYQPDGHFQNEAEREAAQEIVQLLGGFTLAIEVAAVFLGEFAEDVDCQSFLSRLKAEGLEGIEGAASQSNVGIRHGEKLISATLAPTFEKLTEAEKMALDFASLLPADLIPVPWIQAQIQNVFPEIVEDEKPGYPNPWKRLLKRLINLRLFQVVQVSEDNDVLLIRMHGLLGEILEKGLEPKLDEYLELIIKFAFSRSEYLNEDWHNPKFHWEIEPLVRFTQKLLDESHEEATRLVKSLGEWLWEIYNPLQKVIELHRQAIGIFKKAEELEKAILLSNLGRGVYQMGNLVEARALLHKALEIDDRLREPTHPALATSCNDLATVEGALGNLEEAKKLHQKARKIYEQVLPANHRILATSYNNLATVEEALGNLEEAKKLHQKARGIREQVLPANHPHLAISFSNLAIVEKALGNLEEAKKLHQKALEIREQVLPANHPHLATSYNDLATVEGALGNLEEAKKLHQKAREIYEQVLPANHPHLATSYNNLATVEKALGNLEEAKKLHQKALEIREQVLPANHPHLATSYSNLANVEKALGNLEEAKKLHQKALGIREQVLPANHPYLVTSYNNLAIVEKALDNLEEAEKLHEKAREITEKRNKK